MPEPCKGHNSSLREQHTNSNATGIWANHQAAFAAQRHHFIAPTPNGHKHNWRHRGDEHDSLNATGEAQRTKCETDENNPGHGDTTHKL